MTKRTPGDFNGKVCCGDCHDGIPGDRFLTEVNPEGGYGFDQLLVCDPCMESGRWDHWKARKWPNWPNPRNPSP